MTHIRHFISTLLALLPAAMATAEAPRSAIGWLSESLENAPKVVEGDNNWLDFGPEPVTVAPLNAPQSTAVGILPPSITGLARDLWLGLDGEVAAGRIATARVNGIPASTALFKTLLLAETSPPESNPEQVFIARIDRLLDMGALDEAHALITLVPWSDPEVFRRAFDIGLLMDDANPACNKLRETPSLSPTLPARVFCLARNGDWNAAEITLTLGRDLGTISEAQEALIARFLDPDLFEDAAPPASSDVVTPLEFVMREAVALPRSHAKLPLAFLQHDLDPHMPLRPRLDAAERLAKAGIISADRLVRQYRSGEPAASGGIWDRAAAVQSLDHALRQNDASARALALSEADDLFRQTGLRVALANAYRDQLSRIDTSTLPEATRQVVYELLLLASAYEAADAVADGLPQNEELQILRDIAGQGGNGRLLPVSEHVHPIWTATRQGLVAPAADTLADRRLAETLAREGQGSAILVALDMIHAGADTAPTPLRAALSLLVDIGQSKAARAIALQILLAGRQDLRQ